MSVALRSKPIQFTSGKNAARWLRPTVWLNRVEPIVDIVSVYSELSAEE